MVIPPGLTVSFNNNDDTWSGVHIDVYGTLNINAPGQVTINASIRVKPNGRLNISSKLNLGSTSGCGYILAVETDGVVDIVGSTPDRLSICGQEIARGGDNGCNPNYPNGSPPYCEPTSGFTGPTGFDQGGHNGTLPVTWLSFEVRNVDNKSVYLTWSTATEKDSYSFVIERSSNGKNYSEIGTRDAAGSSNEKREYNFTDSSPFLGRTYYRLKQIDFDGSFSYSSIRHIDLSGRKTVSVYPNPFFGGELTIRLNYSTDDLVFVRLFDISGAALQDFAFSGNEFKATSDISSGTYYLKVKTGSDHFYAKFIVK